MSWPQLPTTHDTTTQLIGFNSIVFAPKVTKWNEQTALRRWSVVQHLHFNTFLLPIKITTSFLSLIFKLSDSFIHYGLLKARRFHVFNVALFLVMGLYTVFSRSLRWTCLTQTEVFLDVIICFRWFWKSFPFDKIYWN